jgi:hypothetical protein
MAAAPTPAEEFEERYLALFWRRQRWQWDNYVDAAHHDLNAVDSEIYDLVTSYKDVVCAPGRRGQVLDAIVVRERLDKHPDVAHLRNKLDDRDHYSAGLSAEQRQDRVRYRLVLARRMKDDVLELMGLRQRLAQELGFPSYVALVLHTEGLDAGSVKHLLTEYLRTNLPTARTLIAAHGISWPTWFSDLEAIGPFDGEADLSETITELLDRIGLSRVRGSISVVQKEQAIAGYPGILSVPDDIRILVAPVRSFGGWQILFHELGHAVAHAANLETGIFKTWTSVHDETMATVFEQVAALALLDEAGWEAAQALSVLENTRCAISALFEFALWEEPRAAETLYIQHYGRLGLEIASPEVWAADSFRSIDPVYIHNYVVGATVADRTARFLRQEHGEDLARWGEWLSSSYYADGRKRTLEEKTAVVGGIMGCWRP